MAKGVKKIKRLSNGLGLDDYFNAGDIICVNPNQEASFVVKEWYNETTEEEKRRNITWLLMDQKMKKTFNKSIKPMNVPYGVTLPKKLCGSYAFYVEASLYGGHDSRNTGLHVYGKCEKKVTTASWSKKENAKDVTEIKYGHDLFISLETEGVNGDILTLDIYSEKNEVSIKTIKKKCIDGKILNVKFSTLGYKFFTMGVNPLTPIQTSKSEKFYIKAKDITGKHLTNASGSDKILSITIVDKFVTPEFKIPVNNTPLRVGAPDKDPEEKVEEEERTTEGIIKAYFAKEEFTNKTGEKIGTIEYTIGSDGNKTKTEAEKSKIAGIILKKPSIQELSIKKEYTTLEAIKEKLSGKEVHNIGDKITIDTFKLGAEYKKINSAPLEEEVYVVAKTYLLDGKEVSITIKEKEAIVVDADADVTVLEAKENGAEITTLKAIVENGIAKVKIKLRPKADEELKTWKEKLAGNKKDGTYNYAVKNAFTVSNDLDTIVASIEKKSNAALAPNHIVKKEEIKSLLTEGASYTISNSFEIPKYKKEKTTEMLWLQAECQGDTEKHEGEYLKKDGEYFVIGGNNCSCNRSITENELDIILKKIRGSQDTTIFTDDNCNLDDKSKTSFLNELNKTLKKYEINTCIRKVHFLAQIYHETARLRTTLEYKSGDDYNPGVHADAIANGNTEFGDGPKYRGRGLMQLTWKNNYKLYKRYLNTDVETNYAKVSDELKIAVDSAGWYFKQGKEVNAGNTWTVPDTSFSKFDGSVGKQFSKTTYTYNGSTYSTINMNLLSDQDYIDTISWLVNGGGNGRTERREYLKKLKEIEFFKCGTNKWHDPVDNPMLCLYSQRGETKKPWHGSFGPTIRDDVTKHTGMDLFAKPGMNIYSCVKGEVVRSEINSSMFGELIVIKVIDEETLKSRRKTPFVLKYVNKSEIESQNFDHNGPFYLVYAHLKERKVAIGDIVNAGEIIGLTGTSGENGVPFSTKNPHLHFEIMNVERQAGLEKKCNPGVYLTYKDEDSLTAADTAEQEEARTDSKFWKQ